MNFTDKTEYSFESILGNNESVHMSYKKEFDFEQNIWIYAYTITHIIGRKRTSIALEPDTCQQLLTALIEYGVETPLLREGIENSPEVSNTTVKSGGTSNHQDLITEQDSSRTIIAVQNNLEKYIDGSINVTIEQFEELLTAILSYYDHELVLVNINFGSPQGAIGTLYYDSEVDALIIYSVIVVNKNRIENKIILPMNQNLWLELWALWDKIILTGILIDLVKEERA